MPWCRGSRNSCPFPPPATSFSIPFLTGWPDQGQFTDVMMHLGTLLAILIYFWRDVLAAHHGRAAAFPRQGHARRAARPLYSRSAPSRPSLFGFALEKLNMPDLERNITVVAWNTIIYGVLMLIADMFGPQEKTIDDMTLEARHVHRRGPGACAHSRHQPFRRHHDGRALPRFHPARLRALFLPARHPGHRPPLSRSSWARRIKRRQDRIDELACAGLTFVAGLAAIAFLMAMLEARELPALRALPHGARRLPARAALRVPPEDCLERSATGCLRPRSENWPLGRYCSR